MRFNLVSKTKALAAVTLLSCAAVGCSQKNGTYCAEIYAVNDIHGKYFDSLYVDNQANRYSLANVSTFLKERRAEIGADKVAMIDLGDALQGDNAVFYANYIDTSANGKHLFTRVVEHIGYDALIVGNHDIEAGHAVYDKIAAETDIPYLAANAIDVVSGKSYFKPYTIINKGGLDIAIIGMTNPNIKKWLGEELWRGMDFVSIDSLTDSLITHIKGKYAPDLIFLAIHAGLGDG
ncbi:MAG: bifunctional metallophosphatase/5'-nucleotidase, partial [Bacteroidales bacterium]|nr:bifunctional metallophosphatase/5'-nucleotidase [Bacteroidales bacterium]